MSTIYVLSKNKKDIKQITENCQFFTALKFAVCCIGMLSFWDVLFTVLQTENRKCINYLAS